MTQRILDTARQLDAPEFRSEQLQQITIERDLPRWKQAAPASVLAASDAAAIGIALFLAPVLTGALAPPSGTAPLVASGLGTVPWLSIYALLPVLLAGLALSGVYGATHLTVASPSIRAAGVLSFAAMVAALAILLLEGSPDMLTLLALAWAAAMVLLPTARLAAVPLVKALRRQGFGTRPIVIIGTYPDAQEAARAVQAQGGAYFCAGVVELAAGNDAQARQNGSAPFLQLAGQNESQEDVVGAKANGDFRSLLRTAPEHCAFLISAPPSQIKDIEAAVLPLFSNQASVYLDLSALLRRPLTSTVKAMGTGMPAVRLRAPHESWHYTLAKRVMDVSIALVALAIAAPVMLCIALAIKMDSPGSILFNQTRAGRHGRPFQMYKFRSMRTDAEAIQAELEAANEAQGPMFKIRNDPRMTRVGRTIRRLSLDELPQLINVLQGSMSIVGPRPPLPREVMEYEPWQLRRLDLTPGITGLWQVSRSDTSSFEEMVQMDLEYTSRWSLFLDMRILLKTLPAMLLARGAY